MLIVSLSGNNLPSEHVIWPLLMIMELFVGFLFDLEHWDGIVKWYSCESSIPGEIMLKFVGDVAVSLKQMGFLHSTAIDCWLALAFTTRSDSASTPLHDSGFVGSRIALNQLPLYTLKLFSGFEYNGRMAMFSLERQIRLGWTICTKTVQFLRNGMVASFFSHGKTMAFDGKSKNCNSIAFFHVPQLCWIPSKDIEITSVPFVV